MQGSLAGSDPFHAAVVAAAAWEREARRLADVEFRFAQRYRLWDVPANDARKRDQLARLFRRRDQAVTRAEEASCRLREIWQTASERLVALSIRW